MPHGLDHIVHAVRDLDAAAEFYGRAGFTVGARNRHPWGTHNRIVQLKNCYIEILEVAEPEKIVPHGARSFSFGAFNRDFLASHQGFSMLILNSSNAADDARAFEAAGIGGYDVFDFAREGAKPDGTPVKLAFSLVFASYPASPNLGFAACQHHFPDNFWNPAFQIHANGAQTVAGAAMVADNPTDHHIFLKAFSGVQDLHSSSIGVKAHRERRYRDHGAGRVSRPVRHFACCGRRGDDAQRATLRGRGHGTSRSIASAEWRCLAAPYGAARGAAGCRPWRNPDIRDR